LKVVKSCSYLLIHTFAAGCIDYPQWTTSQTDGQTDTRQYHANSQVWAAKNYTV